MKVLVAVKRVIDYNVKVRVKADGSGVETANVKMSMNPFDEIAVEEAVRLKEGGVVDEVVAVSLGVPKCQETLRTALAMGADQSVLLKGQPSADGLGTAEKLAAAIRDREFDLVLFGKQAIDDDNLQVPAMVAQLLDLPSATVVVDLKVEGRKVTAEREVEGGHEVVQFELPAVVAAQKGLNEPRYASLKGIMAAKKKPLEEIEVGDAESRLEVLAVMNPPERSAGEIVGEGADAVPELVRKLREEAKVL
jgi:electron transfer flavoprotein beta subunit